MGKKHYNKSVYRSFALLLQIGINMLVPICMMTALGIFLDRKFDTSFWMIILFILGAIAGGQNSYRMVKRIMDSPKENGLKEKSIGNADDGNNQESK